MGKRPVVNPEFDPKMGLTKKTLCENHFMGLGR